VALTAAIGDSGDRWHGQVGEDQGEARDSFWAPGEEEAHRRMRSTAAAGRPVKLTVAGRRGSRRRRGCGR
jgi:hypothetical protein